MRVLVTGANGYIGQGVVRALAELGVDVIAVDFATDHIAKHENITAKACNLFDVEEPFEAFGEPDALLHLAWRDGFKHASLNHINDLPNHYNFIRDMIKSGIKQVCVMGSVHEVGFFEGSVNEDTPTNPQSLYGIAKNALRQSIEVLQNDYEFVFQWLRGYYIVGNSEYGCSIFSKITAAEHEGKELFPFTTGENQFDFVDYEEFCLMIAKTVMQDQVTGIINCSSGRPEKIADRVERFISDNHYNIKLQYGAFPDRPYDSKAVWGNNDKITKIMEM